MLETLFFTMFVVQGFYEVAYSQETTLLQLGKLDGSNGDEGGKHPRRWLRGALVPPSISKSEASLGSGRFLDRPLCS